MNSCSSSSKLKVDYTATKLNVRELGAKGNGITDDTYIFQEVFNNAKPGQKIFIPKGKYIISAPLLVRTDQIEILGEGDESQLVFNNHKDYYSEYGTRVGMLNIISSHVQVKKLYLDQNFRNSQRSDGDKPMIGGILIGGKYLGKPHPVIDLKIDSVSIYDYYGDAISVFSSKVENFEVSNCRLTSSFIAGDWESANHKGEQGISVAIGKDIVIKDNLIYGALDDAIAVHRNNENVKIINNKITTTGGRILINGTTNGVVSNNHIQYIQDGGCAIEVSFDAYAKFISKNNDILIKENTIRIDENVNIQSAIKIFGGGENITLSNNSLIGNGAGAGIFILDRNSNKLNKNVLSENIIVRHNTINGFDANIVDISKVSLEKNNLTADINKLNYLKLRRDFYDIANTKQIKLHLLKQDKKNTEIYSQTIIFSEAVKSIKLQDLFSKIDMVEIIDTETKKVILRFNGNKEVNVRLSPYKVYRIRLNIKDSYEPILIIK